MNFKLDENFGRTIQMEFIKRGHSCMTVFEEKLSGAPDEKVLGASVREKRIFVTMDHDFSNTLQYSPTKTHGIAVINPPGRASIKLLKTLINGFLDSVSKEQIRGKLWIVEPGRIRVHEPK